MLNDFYIFRLLHILIGNMIIFEEEVSINIKKAQIT